LEARRRRRTPWREGEDGRPAHRVEPSAATFVGGAVPHHSWPDVVLMSVEAVLRRNGSSLMSSAQFDASETKITFVGASFSHHPQ
jgi:hypothetical protein